MCLGLPWREQALRFAPGAAVVAVSPGVVTGELPSHLPLVGTSIPLRSPLPPFAFSLLLRFQPAVWLGQKKQRSDFLKDFPLVKQRLKFSVSLFAQIWSGFFKWTEAAPDNERIWCQNSSLCSEARTV